MSAELARIVNEASRARRVGTPLVMATVVRVRGSSYRKPGARMLVSEERWLAGSVSGGCLEGDVVKKGSWHTRRGEPVVVTYDLAADDPSRPGLGCDGVVDVLLERDPFRVIDFAAHCLDRQERGAVATVLRGGRIGTRVLLAGSGSVADDVEDDGLRDAMVSACEDVVSGGASTKLVEHDGAEAFVEPIAPPPALFVLGAGHDAVPLASLARTMGWDVRVHDRHGRVAARERFNGLLERPMLGGAEETLRPRIDACDRAAAVVMAHDYERDRASLAMLLESRAFYIGMLGPRRRTERMLADLGIDELDPRVRAPVGMKLGGESPAEIALAIAAEVQSAFASRSV